MKLSMWSLLVWSLLITKGDFQVYTTQDTSNQALNNSLNNPSYVDDYASNTLKIYVSEDSCAMYYIRINKPNCDYSESTQHEIHRLCSGALTMVYVISCLIAGLGIPGSIFTIITVCNMQRTSSVVYIGTLAVSDFGTVTLQTIVSLLPVSIPWGVPTYLVYAASRIFETYSHWSLILICLERFISVTFPLQKKNIYTLRNTCLSCGVACLISTIPAVTYGLFFWNLYYRNSSVTIQLADAHNTIYIAIYIVIPGGFITILTLLTSVQLIRVTRRRQGMVAGKSTPSKVESDLNRMMLVSGAAFILLMLPGGIAFMYYNFRSGHYIFNSCPREFAKYILITGMMTALANVNHAINFYVYYGAAAGFRKKFHQALFCKAKMSAKPAN